MNLQVYATSHSAQAENGVFNMILNGVDMNQVISEFNAEQVLDCIDFSKVIDYVAAKRAEDEDE